MSIEGTIKDAVTTTADDVSKAVDDDCTNRHRPGDIRLPSQREDFGPRLWEFFENPPSLTASSARAISAQGASVSAGPCERAFSFARP